MPVSWYSGRARYSANTSGAIFEIVSFARCRSSGVADGLVSNRTILERDQGPSSFLLQTLKVSKHIGGLRGFTGYAGAKSAPLTEGNGGAAFSFLRGRVGFLRPRTRAASCAAFNLSAAVAPVLAYICSSRPTVSEFEGFSVV